MSGRTIAALLLDAGALLGPFVEDGKPISRAEARDILGRLRTARASLEATTAAQQPDELRRAVRGMAAMLGNREWAEHVSTDPDAQVLETAITELQGEHSLMHAALQTIADGLGPAAILAQQVLADLGTAGEQS